MNFNGKVVLITGASSGIGAATAIYFAKLGAKLSLVGRDVPNLEKVSKQCESANSQIPLCIPADINREEDVEKVVVNTLHHYGKLDVLINNAGIVERGTIEETSLAQYDKVMNTNVRSVYYLTMLSVPYLVKTKGNIVNVSSLAGIRSFPGSLAYNLSKAAVDQLTRCIALELALKGIRVNSVNPGVIITELQKRGGFNDEQYAAFLERSKETHALGRPGNAEEVAAAIAFLASDLASNITAALLPVDGGRQAMCPR